MPETNENLGILSGNSQWEDEYESELEELQDERLEQEVRSNKVALRHTAGEDFARLIELLMEIVVPEGATLEA